MSHNHEPIVKCVASQLPKERSLCDLAELFRCFGDTTRMRILYALSVNELCVCAISELLSMQHSAISHQLRILKEARLVDCRREGRTVYYRLADDHVKSMIDQGMKHISE